MMRNFPPKGVKGKGKVTIVEDSANVVSSAEKLNMKYLGTLDHPVAGVPICSQG